MENLINEEWKTIKDYPQYEISNMGRLRSWRIQSGRSGTGSGKRKTPKVLKPLADTKNGYITYKIYNEDGPKQFSSHRLVWSTFMYEVPERDANGEFLDVNHINSVRNDNRLENLEVVTHKQNVRMSRLGRVMSKPIIRTHDDGTETYYDSMSIAINDDCKRDSIYKAIRFNRKYRDSVWRYAESESARWS